MDRFLFIRLKVVNGQSVRPNTLSLPSLTFLKLAKLSEEDKLR